MGRASATARLLSVHSVWARISSESGWYGRDFHLANRRILPLAGATAAERPTVLSGATDVGGGRVSGAARAGVTVVRAAGSPAKFYTRVHMLRAKTFPVLIFAAAVAAVASAANFSGTSALQFTKRVVDFGPRPSGSAANLKLQAYILNELKLDGCTVSEDAFVAQTPKGAVPMKNI